MAIKTGYHGKRKFMLKHIDTCHCFMPSRSRLIFGLKMFKFNINVIIDLFPER